MRDQAAGISGRLAGKIGIVAGGSTGIRKVTALRLAAEGASVVVGAPASERERTDCVVATIEAAGGVALGVSFDATDDASVASLVESAVAKFGGLDIFHANFADLRVIFEDSGRAERVGRCARAYARRRSEGHGPHHPACRAKACSRVAGGAMIYTSSSASIAGEPVRPCYAMAKAGLNALVRHVASGWGRQGHPRQMPCYLVSC